MLRKEEEVLAVYVWLWFPLFLPILCYAWFVFFFPKLQRADNTALAIIVYEYARKQCELIF